MKRGFRAITRHRTCGQRQRRARTGEDDNQPANSVKGHDAVSRQQQSPVLEAPSVSHATSRSTTQSRHPHIALEAGMIDENKRVHIDRTNLTLDETTIHLVQGKV